jgi:hypothetical protein
MDRKPTVEPVAGVAVDIPPPFSPVDGVLGASLKAAIASIRSPLSFNSKTLSSTSTQLSS